MDDSIQLSIWERRSSTTTFSKIFLTFQNDCWKENIYPGVAELNAQLKYFNGRLDQYAHCIIFDSEENKMEFMLTYG